MNKELRTQLASMASTIWETLFWSCTVNDVLCWGVSKKTALIYNQMLALDLEVNGMIHKGHVTIGYDEGHDVFVVHLLDKNMNCIKTISEVYADELGRTIDEEIERPKNVTDETYRTRTFVELINA